MPSAAGVYAVAVLAAAAPFVASSSLRAQDTHFRAQHDTLNGIRRERQALEHRAAVLQGSVRDLSEEVSSIDRRRDATARVVKALDGQIATISADVNDATVKVAEAENELAVKRLALRRRLIDIYKRGPLYTTEVMLSAGSFGDLVARYKYLHLLALNDQDLVGRVEQLRDEVQAERDHLLALQSDLEENRSEKRQEQEELRALERERESSLARTKVAARETRDRLARLKVTEAQLATAIAALEAERRHTENAHTSVARKLSSIKTSDYGKLDWPVDGPLAYSFGKTQTESNTTIRWNGVGIEAPAGTNVRAVAAGKVASVGQLGTYGLTLIIDHGGGDYSIYGSLEHADVRPQESVSKGQVIGNVGTSDPEYPAHLHFEIRHSGDDGRPASVDPAVWLRHQR
jgi:septal ring factor EnvC (AmiA/AmiB activator)